MGWDQEDSLSCTWVGLVVTLPCHSLTGSCAICNILGRGSDMGRQPDGRPKLPIV